jgi:ERCC4-type nuclease
MIVLCDTREPWPSHPWERFLPPGWVLERTSLETGDFCLGSHLDGVLVERKTPGDMASCVGSNRERFERELRRSRYAGRVVVVVEGSLSDVAVAARRVHHSAIIGSIAAWTLRFCPFVFAGSQRLAADFAFRLLAGQLPSDERRRALARRALPKSPKRPREEESLVEPPF